MEGFVYSFPKHIPLIPSPRIGNTIYAAILAVVAANIILVSYIITAAFEERKAQPSDTKQPATESKKEK
jgi:hypothetical protein